MGKHLHQILAEAYKPQIKYHFRNHPQGDELVERMFGGDEELDFETIDGWFAEAEKCNWEEFRKFAKGDNRKVVMARGEMEETSSASQDSGD